jgi:hypothetical protein
MQVRTVSLQQLSVQILQIKLWKETLRVHLPKSEITSAPLSSISTDRLSLHISPTDSIQIIGKYFNIGHDHFFLYLTKFFIHNHPRSTLLILNLFSVSAPKPKGILLSTPECIYLYNCDCNVIIDKNSVVTVWHILYYKKFWEELIILFSPHKSFMLGIWT